MSDEIKEDEEIKYYVCTRCGIDPHTLSEHERMQSEGLCDKCMGEE